MQLLTATAQVGVDAVRLDRISGDGIITDVVDSSDVSTFEFRFGQGLTITSIASVNQYGKNAYLIGGTPTEQTAATWIFKDITPGTYRISASFPGNVNNSSNAKYQLFWDLPDSTPDLVISGVNQAAGQPNFRSYQTLFEYDTAGNVTRSITESLPAGRRAYDSFGNVVYEEDATGAATVYTYDALGRHTKSMVVAPQAIKFTASNVVSYGPPPGWDVDPSSWEVLNGGDTLYLYNGARKAAPLNYRVTANTVLEFDFEAVGNLAELHAIGFSTALGAQTAKTFSLGGSSPNYWQPEVNATFATYQKDSGQRHFRIPVGLYLPAGTYNYLAFVNYDQGSFPSGPAKEGKSYFSNLRIYESAGGAAVKEIEFTSTNVFPNGLGTGFDEDPDSWKVLDNGRTLYLFDGARKAVPLYYQVTSNSVLEFDFKADGNLAELQGIGFSAAPGAQTARTFAVAGTSPNSWTPEVNWAFANYAPGSGLRHFRIPVGQFLSAGTYNYLAFVNYDHGNTPGGAGDAPKQGKSYFSNVRLHEGTGLPSVAATTYSYDASGRVISSMDALNRTTAFAYDSNGRVVKTTFADGTYALHQYDEAGNCNAVTDELGRTTHYVYDDRNRVVQTIFADGTSTRTRFDGSGQIVASFDELGHASLFTYDKAGRLLTTTAAAATTDQTRSVNKYDPRGRLVESVDGNGNVTKYKYDNVDRLIQTTVLDTSHEPPVDASSTPVDPAKMPIQVTTIEYDSNGHVARTAIFDPRTFAATPANYSSLLNTPTLLITPQNELENKVQVVRTKYDAFGNVVQVTNADNTSTSTIYDAAGRARFSFDELGRKTERVYDAYGRLEKVIQPDPDGAGPGERPYARYVRNAAGDVSFEAEYVGPGHLGSPDLFETVRAFAYDARGRNTFLRDKYDSVATDYVYDVAGQLVAIVDPERNVTLKSYDDRGRVVVERAADPDDKGAQLAPVTTHVYDAVGNLTLTTDPLGNTTSFTYDSLNRLKAESRNHTLIADDASGGDALFSTPPSNTALTGENEQTAVGRDVTLITAGTGVNRQATWTFTNLEAGTYVVSLSAPTVLYSPGTTSIEVIGPPSPPGMPSTLGQLSASADFQTMHGEAEVAWRPLTQITLAAGANLSLRLTAPVGYLLVDAVRLDREVANSFGYDKNGNLTSQIDTRGNATTYKFDELGKQIEVKTPDPDDLGVGNLPLTTQTTYDGYGNVIRTVELRDSTNAADDRTNTFKYDRRNRLTEEVVDAGTGHLNVTTTL